MDMTEVKILLSAAMTGAFVNIRSVLLQVYLIRSRPNLHRGEHRKVGMQGL